MSAVPATPVVLIDVTGGTVHVNGDLVTHDGTRSLHEVGVHAAAERIAVALDRPVRAHAIDESGRTSLVIHPDGSVSDIRVVEVYPAREEPAGEMPAAVATPATPAAPEAIEPLAEPALAEIVELRAGRTGTLAAPAVEGAADAGEIAGSSRGDIPTAHRAVEVSAAADPPRELVPPRRRPGLGTNTSAAMLAAVTVILLGAVGAVLLAGGWRGEAKQSPTPTSAKPSTAVQSTTPSPSSPPPAAAPAVAQALKVSASGGVELIRFRIRTTVQPTQAMVVVRVPGRVKPMRRVVDLTKKTATVTISGLPAGSVRWSVEVPNAPAVSGVATVTATPAPSSGGSGTPAVPPAGSSSGGSHGGKPGGGAVDGGLG